MYEFTVFFNDGQSIRLFCQDIQYGIGVIEGTVRERGLANVHHYTVKHENEGAELPSGPDHGDDDWEAA